MKFKEIISTLNESSIQQFSITSKADNKGRIKYYIIKTVMGKNGKKRVSKVASYVNRIDAEKRISTEQAKRK